LVIAAALRHDYDRASNLLGVTVACWTFAGYHFCLRPLLLDTPAVQKKLQRCSASFYTDQVARFLSRYLLQSCILSLTQRVTFYSIERLFYGGVVMALVGFVVWDSWGSFQRLTGVAGMFCFFVVLCFFSKKPTRVRSEFFNN
jgi:hypothetical protein